MILLIERLTARYRTEGFQYPSVAATAVACRGLIGLERNAFAKHLGISESEIEAFESGHRSATELTDAYARTLIAAEICDILCQEERAAWFAKLHSPLDADSSTVSSSED